MDGKGKGKHPNSLQEVQIISKLTGTNNQNCSLKVRAD